MKELLVVALILACPLAMLWMMRGHSHVHADAAPAPSLDQLRRQRDELNRLIEQAEEVDEQTVPPAGGSPPQSAPRTPVHRPR